ncbi:MAG: hypothetical protein HYX71_06670 [Opitutae bacterium]|nr:hypothetical protein [Opitutae bacterium]
MTPASHRATRFILFAACVLILVCYGAMINRKGIISTDEGMRLAIVNGGAGYTPGAQSPAPTWSQVLHMNRHCAYQPLYLLLLNTLMRVTGSHDLVLFRSVGIGFLALCLLGLLTLSRAWELVPRLFLLGLFSFNAYLFMHVLQIREYIAGVAFYIWSTWLVLHLDARRLERPWRDIAWFAAYGVLLTLGFYLQSWVVFPAIAQGLFLLVRRTGGRLRFYAHLALSYLIVLSVTVPYLLANPQKADVGRWGTETSQLWSQLSTGFHLVLAGHLPGQHGFTDLLFWLWLGGIALGPGAALGLGKSGAIDDDDRRSGRLVLLCSLAALAFQIGYALRVENLSLWPRYFVIHYFFLTWLIALGFNWLWTRRRDSAQPRAMRSLFAAVACLLLAVAAGSAVFQTRSYCRDPYLDTGFNNVSNWQSWTRDLNRVIRPDDVMLTNDYIFRATLTIQLPMANRQVLLGELEYTDLREARRVIYLEGAVSLAQRGALEAALLGQGFPHLQEIPMYSVDGRSVLSDSRILVFSRD